MPFTASPASSSDGMRRSPLVCADLTFSDAFAAVDLPTSIALTLAERVGGWRRLKRFVAEKARGSHFVSPPSPPPTPSGGSRLGVLERLLDLGDRGDDDAVFRRDVHDLLSIPERVFKFVVRLEFSIVGVECTREFDHRPRAACMSLYLGCSGCVGRYLGAWWCFSRNCFSPSLSSAASFAFIIFTTSKSTRRYASESASFIMSEISSSVRSGSRALHDFGEFLDGNRPAPILVEH